MKNKNESYLAYFISKLRHYFEDKNARFVLVIGGGFFIFFIIIIVISLILSSSHNNKPYLTKKVVFSLVEKYCTDNTNWYYKTYPTKVKFNINHNYISYADQKWKLSLLPERNNVAPIVDLALNWTTSYNYNDIEKSIIANSYSHVQPDFSSYSQNDFTTGDFADKKYNYNLYWTGSNNEISKFLISKTDILNNIKFSHFLINQLSFTTPSVLAPTPVNVNASTFNEINVSSIKSFPDKTYLANSVDISKDLLVFRVVDNNLSIVYNKIQFGYTYITLVKTPDNKLIIYIWNFDRYILDLSDPKINLKLAIQLIS